MEMSNTNQFLSILSQAKANPDQFIQQFAKSNPQFAQFLDKNKGKSIDQIAKDYGVDLNLVTSLFK